MMRSLIPHVSDAQRYALLDSARTIAIIGAKDRAGHPVDDVGRYLIQAGYTVLPVHPVRKTVWGLAAWKNIGDITEPIDIINIFRAPEACLIHAEEAVSLSIPPRAFWMQLGIVNSQAARLVSQASILTLEDVCIKTEHQRLQVPNKSSSSVFNCRQCGQCCMGEGGIVLGQTDIMRLSQRFSMNETTFLEVYAVPKHGKYTIRSGPDGNCVFFRRASGCTVHQDKPLVCRAWPFFRGNMVDKESFTLAKDFCTGIRPDASHAEFVTEGLRYLAENSLSASDNSSEPTALTGVLPTREHA